MTDQINISDTYEDIETYRLAYHEAIDKATAEREAFFQTTFNTHTRRGEQARPNEKGLDRAVDYSDFAAELKAEFDKTFKRVFMQHTWGMQFDVVLGEEPGKN